MRKSAEKSKQKRVSGEEDDPRRCFFWGSLHNVRVGVSVTGCLRWGARLWVSECGSLHHARIRVPAPCLFDSAPPGSRSATRARLCVRACGVCGAGGRGVEPV